MFSYGHPIRMLEPNQLIMTTFISDPQKEDKIYTVYIIN